MNNIRRLRGNKHITTVHSVDAQDELEYFQDKLLKTNSFVIAIDSNHLSNMWLAITIIKNYALQVKKVQAMPWHDRLTK
jgi:hypothetical protein